MVVLIYVPRFNQTEAPAWHPRQATLAVSRVEGEKPQHDGTHNEILDSILGIELDADLVTETRLSSIQTARLNTVLI
jgi:hypothetical protein